MSYKSDDDIGKALDAEIKLLRQKLNEDEGDPFDMDIDLDGKFDEDWLGVPSGIVDPVPIVPEVCSTEAVSYSRLEDEESIVPGIPEPSDFDRPPDKIEGLEEISEPSVPKHTTSEPVMAGEKEEMWEEIDDEDDDEPVSYYHHESSDSSEEKKLKKEEEEDDEGGDEVGKRLDGRGGKVKLGVVKKPKPKFKRKRKKKPKEFLPGLSVRSAILKMEKDRVIEVPDHAPEKEVDKKKKKKPSIPIPSHEEEEERVVFHDDVVVEIPAVIEPPSHHDITEDHKDPSATSEFPFEPLNLEEEEEGIKIEEEKLENLGVVRDPVNEKRRSQTLEEKRKRAAKLRKILYIKEVKRRIRKSQNVDLVFLVDCTGTMQSQINLVKRNCIKISKIVRKTFERFSMRCAFIGYRDFESKKGVIERRRFEILPLGDVERLHEFLERVKASGGGDTAEDVFGGLERVKDLEFDQDHPTRLLIHIADAPCHGTEFHDPRFRTEDYYPDGDPSGRSLETLLGFLRDHMIHYFFVQVEDVFSDKVTTNVMLKKFSEIYENDVMKLVVFSPGQPILKLFIKAINESIKSSISYSKFMMLGSRRRGGKKKSSTLDI